MAKWGEGDPRWIVEQRADSHNVNNWHWRETDATEWGSKFLKEALPNIVLDDPKLGQVKITEVSTLEGEASCSIRKQKFIFIFDWEKVFMKWTGKVNGLDTDFSGTIKILNFDHDCDDEDDLDFEVRFAKDGPPEHAQLKAFLKKTAPKRIWEAFMLYKTTCREFYKDRLVLSKANGEQAAPQDKPSATAIKLDTVTTNSSAAAGPVNKQKSNNSTSPKKEQSSSPGAKMNTKKITMNDKFKCDTEDIVSALLDTNKIKVWSQNSLNFEHSSKLVDSSILQKGSKFDLFGKNVQGQITKINGSSSIEMQWRLGQWPASHYSNVVFKFEQKDDGILLSLEQTQVPAEFVNMTTEGWKRYYFAAIKQSFGYGMSMF